MFRGRASIAGDAFEAVRRRMEQPQPRGWGHARPLLRETHQPAREFGQLLRALRYQQGPWQGTFNWRRFGGELAVPDGTADAVLRVGLNGGTGRMGVDDVRVTPVPR